MTASGGHQSALARVLRRTGVILAVAATCGLVALLYAAPRVGAACGDPQAATIFSAAVQLFASTDCPHYPEASFTATPNPVPPGGTVAFNGSASADPDDAPSGGAIATYEWDYDGDGNYETSPSASPATTHVYPQRGRFLSRLRVTDNNLPAPVPPHAPYFDVTIVPINVTNTTAAFTPSNAAPFTAESVTLNAAASSNPDAPGQMTFRWDLDGNGSYETPTTGESSAPALAASWATAGNRVVGLRVTDDSGAQVFTSRTVAVQNRAPLAVFSATPPVIAGQSATLDASGSFDPDGTVARYEWDFDNNGVYETDGGTASALSHVFPVNGAFTVGLRVTDNTGASATTSRTVTVTRAPVAQISASPNPAVAGQKVSLSAAGSGALDGQLARYDWDLDGNGSYETFTGLNPAASRAYPNRGRITVAVRVTDSFFGTATKYVTLSITEATGGGGGTGGGGTGGGGGTAAAAAEPPASPPASAARRSRSSSSPRARASPCRARPTGWPRARCAPS